MRKIILGLLIFFAFVQNGLTQVEYSGKVETGYLKFIGNTIDVDPGPDWKGYHIENENGIDLSLINGIKLKNKIFTGIGLGYLNFEGNEGYSIFADLEYLPLKSRLTPLLNMKMGYNHLWNQYEKGTGTGLGEFCIGLNYRMTEKMDIYAKSGFTMTQQSLLIPIRLGIRF
jgi:hypothetical protein